LEEKKQERNEKMANKKHKHHSKEDDVDVSLVQNRDR